MLKNILMNYWIVPDLPANCKVALNPFKLSVEDVVNALCKYYNDTEDAIFANRGGYAHRTVKKHVGFYFLYTYCYMSYPQIAKRYDYNHSSIVKAMSNYNLNSDAQSGKYYEMKNDIEKIKKLL